MRLSAAGPARQATGFGLKKLWAETDEIKKLSNFRLAEQHLRLALHGMLRLPATTLLTMFTIAMALALQSGVLMLFENTSRYLQLSGEQITLSLFLRDQAPANEIQKLARELEKSAGVEKISFHSKADALEQFRKDLGTQASLLEGLERENPLPASFEITFGRGQNRALALLAERYKSHALIEEVQYNEGLLRQVAEMLKSIRLAGALLVLAVVLMTIFIIGSTIKLALYSRRDEIEIMQLVGATSAFVRAPFLIEGALQGLFGSALGLLLIYGIYSALADAIQHSTFFSLVLTNLEYLSLTSIMLVLILGMAVGLAGSYLSLKKFKLE